MLIPSEYTAERARALDRMSLPDIETPLNVKTLWLDIMCEKSKEARSYSGTHEHSFHELHIIFDGCAVYECEEDTVTLSEGQALLLAPHTAHRFLRADNHLCKASLAFSIDKAGAALLPLRRDRYEVFAIPPEMAATIDRILRQAEQTDLFTPVLISNGILEMLYATFRALSMPLPHHCESGYDTRYLVAKSYIAQNKHRLIVCEDVAKECCLSVKQLSRIFKMHTDLSLFEYIIRSRVNYAKKLLDGQHSVKEIGYMLGFENESSFIAFFKRQCGMPPGVYRRENVRNATENVRDGH